MTKLRNKAVPYRLLLIISCVLCLSGMSSQQQLSKDLAAFPKDIRLFSQSLPSKPETKAQLAARKAAFFKHYFSPWQQPFLFHSQAEILKLEKATLNEFNQQPGYNSNKLLHPPRWIKQLRNNMQLAQFPNTQQAAIAIRNSDLRRLPTMAPSFVDIHQPWQGYPFDRLQNALVHANTPLFILHTSQDGAWQLVSTPYRAIGWVKSVDIATVDQAIQQQWQQAPFVAITIDQQPVIDQQGHFQFTARVGTLLPLLKSDPKKLAIYLAVRDQQGRADLKIGQLRTAVTRAFPQAFNPKVLANIAHQFIEQPYGWGEQYGYRDCSALMKDIFTPFGIWLPRNSSDQAKAGHTIDLSKQNNQQKLALIREHGQAFSSLIFLPGHIMLYIGEQDGMLYTYHTKWGLKVTQAGKVNYGRSLIAKTIINPLGFEAKYDDVTQSMLDDAKTLTLLQ